MQSQRLVHKHVGRAFFIGGYSYQKRCTLRAKHIGNICCCAVRHYVRSTDKVRPLRLLPVRAEECPCALGIPCSNRNIPIPIKVAVSVDEQNHTAVDARKCRARQLLDALYGFPRQFPALGLSLLKENRNAITVCKAADRQRILEVR